MAINYVHRRQIIRGVPGQWRSQYREYADDHKLAGGVTVGEIRSRLGSLDLEKCSTADIDAAIGASGWAENKCDNCEAEFPALIAIGDLSEEVYARYVHLCGNCLAAASGLLKSLPVIP